jgi:hypothetical protein
VGDLRVCKGINQLSAEEQGEIVVEYRPQQTPQNAAQNHQVHIQLTLSSLPSCRRDNHFRGEWNEGALDGHQQRDGEVVDVSHVPVNDSVEVTEDHTPSSFLEFPNSWILCGGTNFTSISLPSSRVKLP